MASQFWEMAVQEMRHKGLFGKTNRANYESLNREIEGGSNPLGGQKITVRFRRIDAWISIYGMHACMCADFE